MFCACMVIWYLIHYVAYIVEQTNHRQKIHEMIRYILGLTIFDNQLYCCMMDAICSNTLHIGFSVTPTKVNTATQVF